MKQPIGHLLLVGQSGVGKTTLSRFVAWMNELTVFQIKAGRNYGVGDFDADLRSIMKRAGCKGEKICFIFDESNVLGPAFLERMNALLASGEVPGLFEGDEYISLLNTAREHMLFQTELLPHQLFTTDVLLIGLVIGLEKDYSKLQRNLQKLVNVEKKISKNKICLKMKCIL